MTRAAAPAAEPASSFAPLALPNVDADVQRDVARYHVAGEPPRVRHLLGVGLPPKPR